MWWKKKNGSQSIGTILKIEQILYILIESLLGLLTGIIKDLFQVSTVSVNIDTNVTPTVDDRHFKMMYYYSLLGIKKICSQCEDALIKISKASLNRVGL